MNHTNSTGPIESPSPKRPDEEKNISSNKTADVKSSKVGGWLKVFSSAWHFTISIPTKISAHIQNRKEKKELIGTITQSLVNQISLHQAIHEKTYKRESLTENDQKGIEHFITFFLPSLLKGFSKDELNIILTRLNEGDNSQHILDQFSKTGTAALKRSVKNILPKLLKRLGQNQNIDQEFLKKTDFRGYHNAIIAKFLTLNNQLLTTHQQTQLQNFISTKIENRVLVAQFLNELTRLQNENISYQGGNELSHLYELLEQINFRRRETPDFSIDPLLTFMKSTLGFDSKIPTLITRATALYGGKADPKVDAALERALISVKGFLESFENFIIEAEKLQSKRPEIFVPGFSNEIEEIFSFYEKAMELLQNAGDMNKRLINNDEQKDIKSLLSNIYEFSAPTNSQILGQTLNAIKIDTITSDREIPLLVVDYPNAPSRAIDPSFQLKKDYDDNKEVDLDFETRIYYMQDTLGMVARIPFPFKGKMTVKEARQLILFVNDVSQKPETYLMANAKEKLTADEVFQKTLKNYEYTYDNIPEAVKKEVEEANHVHLDTFDPEDAYQMCRDYMRQKIYEFAKQGAFETGKGIANFNDTPTLKKGWAIQEQSEFKKYQANPSTINALAAARVGNFFKRADGIWSLFPEKINELESMTTIKSKDVIDIKDQWLQGKQPVINTTIGEIKNDRIISHDVSLSFLLEETQIKNFEDLKFLKLTINVPFENENLVQVKYYEIPPGKTKEQIIEEIYDSGMLEKDILIAKAKFMRDIATIRAGKELL